MIKQHCIIGNFDFLITVDINKRRVGLAREINNAKYGFVGHLIFLI